MRGAGRDRQFYGHCAGSRAALARHGDRTDQRPQCTALLRQAEHRPVPEGLGQQRYDLLRVFADLLTGGGDGGLEGHDLGFDAPDPRSGLL
jgi:hypothetical protein